MSHRSRQQATHDLTAERVVQSDQTDEYNQPLPAEEQVVVSDVPVRFTSGGTDFVRADTGEVVERSDEVVGPSELSELEEGDEVTLKPRGMGGQKYEELEVRNVQPHFDRHSSISQVTVGLEGI